MVVVAPMDASLDPSLDSSLDPSLKISKIIIKSHERHNAETVEYLFYNHNAPVSPRKIPNGKTSIYFGYNFKRPLCVNSFPNTIVSIELPHYNGTIEPHALPASLRTLILGNRFDHPIVLPPDLETLRLGTNYHHACAFPSTLRYLEFNPSAMPHYRYPALRSLRIHAVDKSSTAPPFPVTLERLEFGDDVDDIDVDKISKLYKLKTLVLGQLFNKQIILPPTVSTISIGYNAEPTMDRQPIFSINYSETLECLMFDCDSPFNESFQIPPRLKVLKLGNHYNQPLRMNKSLTSLMVGDAYDKPLDLPATLVSLQFTPMCIFNHPLKLPRGLCRLYLPQEYTHIIDLPKDLLQLEVGKNFTQPLCQHWTRLYELRMYCKNNHHKIILPPTITHFWHSNKSLLAQQNLKCFHQPIRYCCVEQRWKIFDELVDYVMNPDRINRIIPLYGQYRRSPMTFFQYCKILDGEHW